MLDTILAAAFAVVVVTTSLLLASGSSAVARPRLRGAASGLILAVGAVAAVASTTPPLVVLGGVLAAGVRVMPARWTTTGATFLASLLVLLAVYAAVLVQATLALAGGPLGYALGVVLLGLELGAMALIAAAAFEMVDALCSDRRLERAAERSPERPLEPATWPVVCLQVPTYNEPPELVVETIRSLAALDYPALRIQVIDNNTTDERLWQPVEEACLELGLAGTRISFVHLPEWPGYKAGALNWGRTHLDPDVEIVGVVDADYVVESDWLREAVPPFSDPAVGFVQTPQDYRAWESSGFYRACYVGFAYFFRIGMVSRAHRNAIIFAGTMGLIRRSTLDGVGGWDERIITEDAEISLRVLVRGERSVYIERPFGRGIMPLTYEGLRKQRYRWAFGGIQILRRHWRTILGRRSGLTLGQRYDHLVGGLWWFNDALTFGFSLFVIATAIGIAIGRPFVVQRLTAIGLVLPVAMIVLNLVRYLWALRRATGVGPALALAALRVNLSLSWVIALACLRALTQDRGVFLRTPKFRGAATIRELRLVAVEVVLASTAVLLGLVLVVRSGAGVPTATVLGLLAWMALIYGSAASFALGDPTRAPIGEALREKMALEISPRVGRVARSRPARAGFAATLFAALAIGVLAVESGRAPIEELPFRDLPNAAIDFGAGDRPAADASQGTAASAAVGGSASPPAFPRSVPPGGGGSGGGAGGSQPGATPSPTARATQRPTPTPTVPPAPTPTPRPSPPVAVPTPAPTARPSAPPHPSPSVPPHP